MPSWNWDESASESGVVHQSTTNTDHNDASLLKQGYDYANFSEITPDPTHAYPLHEDSGSTANDVAGTVDGSISGATLGQTGILDTTAYSFDGSDDIVDMGHVSGLEGPDAISVFSWVNSSGLDGNGRAICINGGVDTDINTAWFLRETDQSNPTDEFEVFITDGSEFVTLTSDTSAATGIWHYVGFTYDGSTVNLYVNGKQEASSGALSGSLRSDTTDPKNELTIGAATGNALNFDGTIADTRIYLTGLSQAQMQSNYDVVDTAGSWTSTTKSL